MSNDQTHRDRHRRKGRGRRLFWTFAGFAAVLAALSVALGEVLTPEQRAQLVSHWREQ